MAVPVQMELDSKGVGHFINLTDIGDSDDEADGHIGSSENNIVQDNEDTDTSNDSSEMNGVKDDNHLENSNDSFENHYVKENDHTHTCIDTSERNGIQDNTEGSPDSSHVLVDVVDSVPKSFAQEILTATEVVLEMKECISDDGLEQSSDNSAWNLMNLEIVIATQSKTPDENANAESTSVGKNKISIEKGKVENNVSVDIDSQTQIENTKTEQTKISIEKEDEHNSISIEDDIVDHNKLIKEGTNVEQNNNDLEKETAAGPNSVEPITTLSTAPLVSKGSLRYWRTFY